MGENLPFVKPDNSEDFEIQNDVQNETCRDNNRGDGWEELIVFHPQCSADNVKRKLRTPTNCNYFNHSGLRGVGEILVRKHDCKVSVTAHKAEHEDGETKAENLGK